MRLSDLLEVFGNSVEVGQFVEQPLRAALGTGAVVALDVDHQRVVQFAHFLDGVEDAPHLVIGVRERRGIDFHHVREDLLLVGIEAVPGRNALGAFRQFRVLRDDAQLFLSRQRFLAQLVPTLIELALELRDPLLGRVMRRVGRARRVVLQPGFVGRDGVEHADPLDAAVGQVLVEVVVLGVMGRLDRFDVLDDRRRPLVGIAADEAVEVLEPESGRPEVVGTGLTSMPIGNVVILAVPGGVPAVLLEHLGKRAAALRHERVVAREAAAELHDDAGRRRVVVAPGQQRRPRGRAERRGVELV